MRHYEIVFLVHPDQSDQVPAMVKKYSGIISSGGGKIREMDFLVWFLIGLSQKPKNF